MGFEFTTANRVIFGAGALADAGKLAKDLGGQALVVTGSDPDRAAPLLSILKKAGLTSTEYQVLCYLAGNAGRVVTPNQILEHVWGFEYSGETHLLQVYIARLRKKIGDNISKPKYILTRPGIGYMMKNTDCDL